jgi:hypothetical protein
MGIQLSAQVSRLSVDMSGLIDLGSLLIASHKVVGLYFYYQVLLVVWIGGGSVIVSISGWSGSTFARKSKM